MILIILHTFLFLILTIFFNGIESYPMPQMRICIQSVDPNRLPSQCIYCKSRTFPLTVRMCTGNAYLPARMTLNEASCLVTTCRKQLPRLPPEPYSVVRPFTMNGVGFNSIGFTNNNNNLNNIPMHNQPNDSGNNNQDDIDDLNGASSSFDDGQDSLIAEQASKVRKPAKFFLGKPQKIQTSIRPLLFG